MFRRVLVAVDGSATSMRGLQTAIDLAGDQEAELHVVHVYFKHVLPEKLVDEDFVPARFLELPLVSGREAGRRILDEAAALADKHGLAIKPILTPSRGLRVARQILGQARKVKADVIVMGTHGNRGLRRLVLGSDAESVVRESSVPVLLIREAAAPRRLRASALE